MQKQKISLIILLLVNMLFANLSFANSGPSEKLISNYINMINEKDWSNIPNLWAKGQRDSLIGFFSDKQNDERRLGLFNIKQAHLMALKQIPYEYANMRLPRFIESYNDPQVFYAAVKYEVFREDKYHLNGVNYFFIVTVIESGKRKIALTPHVQVNQIIEDGYGFGYADEKTYDERRIKFIN